MFKYLKVKRLEIQILHHTSQYFKIYLIRIVYMVFQCEVQTLANSVQELAHKNKLIYMADDSSKHILKATFSTA